MTGKPCPACRSRILDSVAVHGATGHLCSRCAGLWFDAGELSESIRAHDPEAVPFGPIAHTVGESVGVSLHRCPNCRQALDVHALSDRNPIRVEVCQECAGAWLPHGNLDMAQAGHELGAARGRIDKPRTTKDWLLQFLLGLPVEFNVAPRRTPIVTYGLVVANMLIYLASIFGETWFLPLLLHPDAMPESVWWTQLFSSQFLHANLIHLFGNMYFLWILGDNVEDVLGRVPFLLFYLVAGAVGGIAYSLMEPVVPALGASGAISGVTILYAILFRGSKLTFMLFILQFKVAAPIYMGIWLVFNLGGLIAGTEGVAWEAHLGGFGFGLLVGLSCYRRLLARRPLLRLLNRGGVSPT